MATIKSYADHSQSKKKVEDWSEEDNAFCNGIISHFEKELKDGTIEAECNDEQVISDLKYCYKQNVNWLKSLRHQNTWKPSDAQMDALKDACDEHWEPDGLDPLYTLWEDLKKLRRKN